MKSIYHLLGVPSTGFDPNHTFETSWLLPPFALAILRLLLSIYCFVCTFTTWGWSGTHHDSDAIGESFSYFTNLTYWGISFYMLFAGLHTLIYAARGQTWLNRWPRPLQALHSLLYSSVITFPFIVTIVYWAKLYSGTWFTVKFDAWANISRHALNSVFAFLEIILPNTNPPPWLHIPLLIIILALYLALAYITRASEGFYVYNFLDPSNGHSGRVAGYCFGILAGFIIVFLVVWGFIWLRRRLTMESGREGVRRTGEGSKRRRGHVPMTMRMRGDRSRDLEMIDDNDGRHGDVTVLEK